MTYAITLSVDDGPERRTAIELAASRIRFGNGNTVPYSELADVYVERRVGAHTDSRPCLVLITHGGVRRRITTPYEPETLYELADRLSDARDCAALV
jgi:hypothetical protein